MPPEPIRFEDGAAYELGMGIWSRLVGERFLSWMAPPAGARWIDVGCGNGAFTELALQRCQPAEIQGIDPSEGQISFARGRPGAKAAQFQLGDAMALPFEQDRFDVATMALVIFFVPEPRRGVDEMIRVVRPGGTVAAYAWDIPGGGFPLEPLQQDMRAAGLTPTMPPQADVSRADALGQLWAEAGLREVRQTSFTVERRFADFAAFWEASLSLGTLRASFERMEPGQRDAIADAVRLRVPADADGAIRHTARANAITGVRGD